MSEYQPQALSKAEQKAADTIQKLLNLAAKAGTPQEAEAAMAKAQELMTKHNLDQATVEGKAGETGRREKGLVEGGFYAWKRELWAQVADLHFCMYWSQKFQTPEKVPQTHRVDGVYAGMRMVHAMRRRHALVGRAINVRLTVGMAQYLEGAIERALAERLKGDGEAREENMKSKWAHSFRKGAADRLEQKLVDRRHQEKAKERQATRRAERAAAGASSGTALTIAAYSKTEEEANADFLYGEGWSAERRKEREERAREREAELREWTEWCAANPEEAAKMAKEEAAKERRNAARRTGGRASYGRRDDTDMGAYFAGSDAAEKIGIDPQAGTKAEQGRIGR